MLVRPLADLLATVLALTAMRHRPLLAKRLRRRRSDAGYSQRQLSDLSGIHFTTIARIETGEVSEPESNTLDALARALGCDRSELSPAHSISRAMGEAKRKGVRR